MLADYKLESNLPVQEFAAILAASKLAERRPVDDPGRLQKMLKGANIIVTARVDGRLVGVARAITDFTYCCYLSDLAVDAAWQRRGIGKRLIDETSSAAGANATLVLLAAPGLDAYYSKIGLQHFNGCWGRPRRA